MESATFTTRSFFPVFVFVSSLIKVMQRNWTDRRRMKAMATTDKINKRKAYVSGQVGYSIVRWKRLDS